MRPTRAIWRVITFRYQRERSSLGVVWRPIADVRLRNGRHRIEAGLYIDSGADLTMLPLQAEQALGFQQKRGEGIREIHGVSGSGVPYLIRRVQLEMDDITVQMRVAWALIEEVPFLLGRLDIFRRFEIVFREANRTITFQ